MKRRLYVFILLVIVSTLVYGVSDSTCFELKRVIIKGADLKKTVSGDSLEIKFDIYVQRGALRTNYKMIFQPYIKGANDSLKLDGIVIYGKNKIKREEQERILQGKRYVEDTNNYERVDKDSLIHYRRTILNREWVAKEGVLEICQILEGCCDSRQIGEGRAILYEDEIIVPIEPPRMFVPVYCKLKQSDTWKFSKEDLTIYYKVSKIEINDTLFSNKQILAEVVNAVNTIKRDNYRRLDKIEITGHASPEGPLKFNQYLGYNRAIALRDYVKSHVDWLTDDDFQINNGVENWDGMRRMVWESDMMYRDQVLLLLDSVKPEDGLKKRLIALDGGKPWKYALKNYFPKLRTARFVSIGYSMVDDQAYYIGNEAVDMMSEGDYEGALEKLQPYENAADGRLYNLLGVCYMMTGNEDRAIEWLQKGIEFGDEYAIENMERIKNN